MYNLKVQIEGLNVRFFQVRLISAFFSFFGFDLLFIR